MCVKSYKYHVLAAGSRGDGKKAVTAPGEKPSKGPKIAMDWSCNIGEVCYTGIILILYFG